MNKSNHSLDGTAAPAPAFVDLDTLQSLRDDIECRVCWIEALAQGLADLVGSGNVNGRDVPSMVSVSRLDSFAALIVEQLDCCQIATDKLQIWITEQGKANA